MYKLVIFVPVTHLEDVKEAVFTAGGGQIGAYDKCCWQVLGQGQFRPVEGSDPFVGTPGKLEQVNEYRLEMVVDAHRIARVVEALKSAHPYEVPAFDITEIIVFE